MIDSDIEGYEFGVMDAKPLDTSPNYSGQNQTLESGSFISKERRAKKTMLNAR